MVYFNYERWCYRVGIINDRIWERRISLRLTLLNVAEQLGVKEATDQRYESGAIKSISHETISRLSEILSCTPSYLMGWDATSRPASHVSDEFQINNLEKRLLLNTVELHTHVKRILVYHVLKY